MEKIKKSLSFVMAGYNEEKIAYRAIKTVWEALDAEVADYEIILVNDGSTDRTLSIMRGCAKKFPHIRVLDNRVNLNYGASVLRGMTAAKKEWVVYDAFDLEMHPKDFLKYFRSMGRPCTGKPGAGKEGVMEPDMVVFERQTYRAVPWRRFASRVYRAALNLIFPGLMRGTPVLNHTQMFRRAILSDILPDARSPIFFAPEMIFRAKRLGLKWENVPIPFYSIAGVRRGAFGHAGDMLWGIHDMLHFKFKINVKKEENHGGKRDPLPAADRSGGGTV